MSVIATRTFRLLPFAFFTLDLFVMLNFVLYLVKAYSTVSDLARFLGLSISSPR